MFFIYSVEYVEDYSMTNYTIRAAKILASAEKNKSFFFGPYGSELTEAMLDIVSVDKKLLLSAGTINSTLFKNKNYSYGLLPGLLLLFF